jgi:hypothetical protein
MTAPALRMCFTDRAALERELEANLKLGRAFVRDAQSIEVLADCMLVLVHPDDGVEHALRGQAVLVSDAEPMRGVGVQLRPFDAQVMTALEAFVRGERSVAARDAPAPAPQAAADASAGEPADPAAAAPPAAELDEADALLADAEPATAADQEALALDDEGGDAAADGPGSPDVQKQKARHERLRKLNQAQQQKIARRGELNDRVVLERLYGRNVWDSLLHNPKLTIPEVARIARKGTVPRPLLELIVDNNTWIQAPMVRRALLSNPRVSSEAIMKLLRITPKHELKIIHKTTTYSSQVRDMARKVLDL